MAWVRKKKFFIVTVTLALTFWMTLTLIIEIAEQGEQSNARQSEILKIRNKREAEDSLVHTEFKNAQENVRMARQKEVMQKRLQVLSQSCENLKELNTFRNTYKNDYLSHLMVDDKNKFIYCFIPKIANTNFRRIFLALQGLVPKEEAAQISGYEIYSKYLKNFVYLDSLNKTARDYRLQNYKKIAFVRKPFERLLSAYRNKFFHPNDDLRLEYYGKVLEFYQKYPIVSKNVRSMEEFMKKPITFHEFLIYWADTFEVGGHINEHFMTYNDLCLPCEVKYDYVGKYDTLNEDVHYIFKDIGLDVDFPERNDNYSAVATGELLLQYYLDMPADVMTRVWDVLRTDHILFDYQIPNWLKNKLQQ